MINRMTHVTMSRVAALILLCLSLHFVSSLDGDPLFQCYKVKTNDHNKYHQITSLNAAVVATDCLFECNQIYFRYAALKMATSCFCLNEIYGSETDLRDCDLPCPQNSSQICGGRDSNIYVLYDTGLTVAGPVQNLRAENITETTLVLKWKAPEYSPNIIGYIVRADVLRTYSSVNLQPLQWKVYNNTFLLNIYNLHPGTTYKFTIQATSLNGLGHSTYLEVETRIGEPDPSPMKPNVTLRGDKLLVHIDPAVNENGPITAYRIVVINEALYQGNIPDQIKSYGEASKDNLDFYITAELTPAQIAHDFEIGDKKFYNSYYNAPISSKDQIEVTIGVVSTKDTVTRVRYAQLSSDKSGVFVLKVGDDMSLESQFLNKSLTIAICFLSVLLLLSIAVLVFLKYRLQVQRRRTPECQELTLQGPMVEMENSGYIPEEELPQVNHYENLREKVWNIPKNFLNIQLENVLGTGTYGRVISGVVQQDTNLLPVAIQIIPDNKLRKNDSKEMLKQLNTQIMAGKHDNIISLIGFYENPTTLYIVFEHNEINFKEWLVHSRTQTEERLTFAPFSQDVIVRIFMDITKGMDHLSKQKIVHKVLCCRNVTLDSRSLTAKVTSVGLSKYVKDGLNLDCTRWSAHEIFRQRTPSTKSDVWSFGSLMWEACTLGGTPFAHIETSNVGNEIRRGMRLQQLSYISDDAYQTMLNCWQLDSDERPSFQDLVDWTLSVLKDKTAIVDFSLYPGFNYEQYRPELETAA